VEEKRNKRIRQWRRERRMNMAKGKEDKDRGVKKRKMEEGRRRRR
jgi:hypothetical protein